MKDGSLLFSIVPNKYGALAHHLEVGPLPANSLFHYLLGPFMRSDEELGRSREVIDIFEVEIVNLPYILKGPGRW